MSGTQPPGPCNNWSQLSHVLPAEQMEQLAQLILDRLAVGWGSVTIEFKDGHIERFQETTSVPAMRSIKTNGGS